MNFKKAFCAFALSLLTAHVQAASGQMTTLAVAAGQGHALALRSDGTVWAWGDNFYGALGVPSVDSSRFPLRISQLSNIVSIAAGPRYSLAVQSDGKIWAWGANEWGQLGTSNFTWATTPVPVSGISNAVAVSAGGYEYYGSHSLALLSNGTVMAWGHNDDGELGNGTTNYSVIPVAVSGLSNVIQIKAGAFHSMALTSSNNVWCWGDNGFGEMGVGSVVIGVCSNAVQTPSLSNITSIAAGGSHCLALKSDATVWSWGYNVDGELGLGTTNNVFSPTQIPSLSHVAVIGAGMFDSAATLAPLLQTGTSAQTYSWGYLYSNAPYALGEAPAFTQLAPAYESDFGFDYSFGLAPDGSVWVWGVNDQGEFGNGNQSDPAGNTAASGFKFQPTLSFTPTPVPCWNEFMRGNQDLPPYCTIVVPLDLEQGVALNAAGNDQYCFTNSQPWFLSTSNQTLYLPLGSSGGTNLARYPIANPMVAFGSQGNGSPLYVNQPYRFGVYAGGMDEGTGSATNVIRISVYDAAKFTNGVTTNMVPTNTFTISLPRRTIATDSNAWVSFMTNGASTTFTTNGLTTTVEFLDSGDPANKPFGLAFFPSNGINPVMTNYDLTGYKLTHTASTTNYFYRIEVLGKVQVATNILAPMATNAAGVWTNVPLYTLDFQQQNPLHSIYVDRLFFRGHPLPPTYQESSFPTPNGSNIAVTNLVTLTNASYTNLDASPELRRSPILDQFVADMNKDPLALTAYVINQIGLTDPYAEAESNQVVKTSITCGGVDRSALGTFLEGQGSPIEQCALLVYLLRQAGYPAAYVFPTNSNLSMSADHISQLWRMQVKGVVNYLGVPYITTSLLTVNYPWVVATIGTNTVHIFPWIKDTKIVEGVNLYDYMPTNYNTALAWVEQYVRGNTNILNLDSENVPAKLFPKFIQPYLASNVLGAPVSLDDLGVTAYDRPHQFPDWPYLPQPDLVTNFNTTAVVDSLSASPGVYPFLSNIFNTAQVQVYSNSVSGTLLLDTGLWDACDFHDRKFLVFTNNSRLCLWLAPYNPTNVGTIQTFSGPSSTALQSNSVALSTITNIAVKIMHHRHAAYLSIAAEYFPATESIGSTNVSQCTRTDVSAIALDYGRVTPAMLRPYEDIYWSLQRQRATNNSFVPSIQDYQGTVAYLLAMGYWQKADAFNALNKQWHKIQGILDFKSGLGEVAAPGLTNMQAKVDMIGTGELILANGTLRPDSGVPDFTATQNYYTLDIVNGSAQEHQILQTMFPDQNAVSTVRLLQLAQARATNGNSPILELVNNNYLAQGSNSHAGYGTTLLKNWNTAVWNTVTNNFAQVDGVYSRALMTPGNITNSNASFIGTGALTLSYSSTAAVISSNSAILHGGFSGSQPSLTLPASSVNMSYTMNVAADGSITYNYINPSGGNVQSAFSPQDAATLPNGSYYTYTAFEQILANAALSQYNQSGTIANGIVLGADGGLFGNAEAINESLNQLIAEPVDPVSGAFYLDTVDLTLPGPFPLQLRRNYLSQNYSANQFGYGWKMNFMPYLVATTNASSQSVIYAAEADGAVIAYRQTNALGSWYVFPQDNPSLNNNSIYGKGSTGNKYNARLDLITTNGNTYVITVPDGSVRTYQQMTFAIVSGTNQLNRTRPYLTKWQDHAGNYASFSYGSDSTANDYGQLNRISMANGNSFVFKYDFYGRIYEAFTGDGRFVQYQYDKYGDLTTVILPDNTQCQYTYQHYTFTNNGTNYTDSNHLMVQEVKPNGRIVANAYDSLNRVTNQASTVGTNLVLVTNAYFYYTNNVSNITNQIASGTTRVEDVFHNPTLYFYTNNLITNTTDPFGYNTVQVWFPDTNNSAPGWYPRSLQYTVDKRGLTNQFFYDSFGNVTQMVVRGDLTGNATYNDSATNTATYTTNQLPSLVTDVVGNSQQFVYDSTDSFRVSQTTISSSGVATATNLYFYTNVATLSATGTSTNYAYGLCWRSVRGGGATNDSTFDGRGFKTQAIAYPATSDNPGITDQPVTTYFAYNLRGQLYQQQTPGGALVQMDYDPMGRTTSRQVFDENNNNLSSELYYYNQNGELEWYDGPRSNPDDFVYYIYDGAGRVIQTTRWRSQAKSDGTGVEAPSGNDVYSTMFQEFDGFGNVKRTIDPRGVVTTNKWDALGRLIQQTVLETNGTTLKSEGYSYEPGDLPSYFTNALGGVTQTLYTSTGKPRYRSMPDFATNAWTYYLDGRVRREYQSNGAFWETTYDDADRRTIRILYNFASIPLATNVTDLDARGNTIRRVDAGGNSFTNSYDGLDRIKTYAGPLISFDPPLGAPPAPGGNPPPVQQSTTNYYDAAGLARTNINALGEKTITLNDALGRVTSVEIRDASNTQVRITTSSYSADHQSQTVTQGSGANALVSTTYTDNQNQPVLTVGYPSAGATEFVLRRYDLVGNLISETHNSAGIPQPATLNSQPSSPAQWTTASYSYDGLNRTTTKAERDGALTTYGYDQGSNPTSRAMPGGLTWAAAYNNANQLLYDFNLGTDSSITRSNHYTYYLTTGLLLTKTDGRGVTCTHFYDDFLRLTNAIYTGSLPEHNLNTTWTYDPRGLLTTIAENYTSNSSPATSVSRAYDAYGQLQGETITVGASTYPSSISRDSAGRRTSLGLTLFGYNYTWRADGMLSSSTGPTGGGTYSYDNAGQLVTRTLGPRVTTISSRDGTGHPLSVATTLSGSAFMTETIGYTGDGLMSSHQIVRSDFTDNRSFTYASSTRWLTSEIVGLNSSANWTNNFTYDNGVVAGPGILTSAAQPSSAMWSGGADAQSRITSQTNHTIIRQAYGRVNGQASVTATLDGINIPVQITGTNAQTWEATLELTPGSHTLTATANHPSGQFTTNASVTITNNATDSARSTYSGAGQITNMVWLTSGGVTNRTRALSWDARNRLIAVTDRDTNNNGFNWTAAYDGFGRRIQTTETIVTNGTALSTTPILVTHYFDPSYEFLELGVVENLKTTWKLMGPDMDGTYGGQNGTGGFDAMIPGPELFCPTMGDINGNIHFVYDVGHAHLATNTSRITGYGAVPGYRPLQLGGSGNLVSKYAWRNRARECWGGVWMGANWYDMDSAQFLTFDDPGFSQGTSVGFNSFQGNPWPYWDADGRYGKPAYDDIISHYRTDLPTGLNSIYNASSTLHSLLGYLGNGIDAFEHLIGLQSGTLAGIAPPLAAEAALLESTSATTIATDTTTTTTTTTAATTADTAAVKIAEGAGYESPSAGGTVYTGAYDPAGNTLYLGDTGHANGMYAAGGNPNSLGATGITVVKTQTGVTWAADSPSLPPTSFTQAQAANVQAALEAQFPGTPVIQVKTIK